MKIVMVSIWRSSLNYHKMCYYILGEQMKKLIENYTLEELKQEMSAIGEKPFRAKQLATWIYQKRIDSFFDMSDISKASQQKFADTYQLSTLTQHTCQISKDKTRKYLFKTVDNHFIETVLMVHDYGYSICVTSQIGCNMGCAFCASGLLKKKRNLEAAEIVDQVLKVQKDIDKDEMRVSNIVVMGIGEPFDNYDNVMKFVKIVNDDNMLGIGARHITISTCGIADKIRKFADENTQVNLAISLHAPNDKLRTSIMPINQAFPLKELFDSLHYYLEKNSRRLTFEYILLKDVNDTLEHSKQLADLVGGMNAYVNLIPYNPVDEHSFHQSEFKQSMRFYDYLMKRKIQCTLRKEHGADIDAACGQLRIKVEKGTN